MGFLHAAYGEYFPGQGWMPSEKVLGAGALAAPLSATQFSQMKHWSFHYLVSLSFSIINMVVLAIVFQFKEQDGKILYASIDVRVHSCSISRMFSSRW